MTKRAIYSETAEVSGWGRDPYARRVTHLTPEERAAVRAGREVRIADCPSYQGCIERRVVAIGSRFYTRMPDSDYVIMRRAPETVGGYTRFMDWWGTEEQGIDYCNGANGMTLALWDRESYEAWDASVQSMAG